MLHSPGNHGHYTAFLKLEAHKGVTLESTLKRKVRRAMRFSRAKEASTSRDIAENWITVKSNNGVCDYSPPTMSLVLRLTPIPP